MIKARAKATPFLHAAGNLRAVHAGDFAQIELLDAKRDLVPDFALMRADFSRRGKAMFSKMLKESNRALFWNMWLHPILDPREILPRHARIGHAVEDDLIRVRCDQADDVLDQDAFAHSALANGLAVTEFRSMSRDAISTTREPKALKMFLSWINGRVMGHIKKEVRT